MDQSANASSVLLNLTSPEDDWSVNAANPTDPRSDVPEISPQTFRDIVRYFNLLLLPCVSVFGIVGNAYSAIFIFRSGLRKSSNILLFCTAVADSIYLASRINIPLLYFTYGNHKFYYRAWEAYVIFGCWLAFSCVASISTQCVTLLPVYMVVERMVAIFLPLHVHLIVTAKRIWIVCFLTVVFFTSAAIGFYCRWHWVGMTYIPQINATIGLVISTGYTDMAIKVTNEYIINHVTGPFSILVVTVGSLLIGIKVTLSFAERRKMSAMPSGKHDRGGIRTTRTLLALCIVYSVTSGIGYTIGFFQIDKRVGVYLGMLLREVTAFFMAINCSANFIIHFLTNPNFRDKFPRPKCRGKNTT